MSPSIWRDRARAAISAILTTLPTDSTPEQARKALYRRDAYPFAGRVGWAYQCWCQERRKAVAALVSRSRDKTPPSRAPYLLWRMLPSGMPWLEVSCGWCDGRVDGGCMMCASLHERLMKVVAHPEFSGLRREARRLPSSRGILCDWLWDNVPDAEEVTG